MAAPASERGFQDLSADGQCHLAAFTELCNAVLVESANDHVNGVRPEPIGAQPCGNAQAPKRRCGRTLATGFGHTDLILIAELSGFVMVLLGCFVIIGLFVCVKRWLHWYVSCVFL